MASNPDFVQYIVDQCADAGDIFARPNIMHSNIYQISKQPIAVEDYVDPCMFYDNCNEYADYIGSAINNTGDQY